MASFDTLSTANINTPSYEEIRDFAIHLKVRFGAKAVPTADYFMHKHLDAGDFLRAEMWQKVSSNLKINDAAPGLTPNRVNGPH
jgi:hypothetical protein